MRHEASLWEHNCFVTLTYARDKLPPRGSLCHADWQDFMKRLRWHHVEKEVKSDVGGPLRFYMCGEYGPENWRPHYHACLFNMDFADKKWLGMSSSKNETFSSALLDAVWGQGMCTVQPFTPSTAMYVAGYVLKTGLGKEGKKKYRRIDAETGEIYDLKPEYAEMSTMPYMYHGVKVPGGIGARWFQKYQNDVVRGDFVVADGQKHQTPRYYDNLYKNCGGDLDEVKFERWKAALKRADDNTDERLAVRESLLISKMERKVRDL